MGLGIGFSRSRADCCSNTTPPAPPNPNPNKFKVMKHEEFGRFLLLWVKYDGCTNYEGTKILVYEGVTWENLQKQGSLDPHFCEVSTYHSPIARFVPTERGWKYARAFCFAAG